MPVKRGYNATVLNFSEQHIFKTIKSKREESKMKKTLALVLALCMVFALCACGTKTDTTAPTNTAVAATDTDTVAVGAVIIARDDVPSDEIYKFVKTIFDNKDAIAQQHGKGKELDVKFASSITSVPYHPGAAKYFKEQGIDVASVKEGAGEGASASLMFGTGSETGTYYGFGGVCRNRRAAQVQAWLEGVLALAHKRRRARNDAARARREAHRARLAAERAIDDPA